MSTADFKGTGSTSGAHPSGSAGLVVAGETLTLQLEASPGLDIERVVFAVVVGDSASAPAITLSPADGIPTPTPLSSISYVVPAGVHTYSIRCVVNNGIDKLGQVRPEWTRTRVFYTETAVNTRKLVPGETTQSGAPWTTAVNALVDAQGSGNTVGAAASVATEVLTAADTTGKVLTRGPLLHVAQAGNALVTPRVAGDALELVPGANGGGAGPPLRLDVGTGSSNATRGNVWMGFRQGEGPSATLGAGGALLMKHVGTAPSGGTYTSERALYPKADGWYESDGTTESKLAAGLTGAGAGTASSVLMVDATGNVLSRSGVTSDGAGVVTLGTQGTDLGRINFASPDASSAKRYTLNTYRTDWGPSQAPPTTGLWDYTSTWGFNVGTNGLQLDTAVNEWAETSEAEYVKPADGSVHGEWYRFAMKRSGLGGDGTTQYRVLTADFDYTNTLGTVGVSGSFQVFNSLVTKTWFNISETGIVSLPVTDGATLVVAGSAMLGTEKLRVVGAAVLEGAVAVGASIAPVETLTVRGSMSVGTSTTDGIITSQISANKWKSAFGSTTTDIHFGSGADGTNGNVHCINGGGVTVTCAALTVKVSSTQVLYQDTYGLQTAGSTVRTGSEAATLASGRTDNYDTAGHVYASTALYLTPNVAGSQLSGIAASVFGEGQELVLYPDATGVLTLNHQDTNSTAGNRFICPGNANKVCAAPDVVRLRYRAGSVNRWLVG